MTEEEQKPKEEKPVEQPADNLVDKAAAAAERIEKANKEMAELLDRQEKLQAQQKLSGRTSAGTPAEKPKELTPIELAEKVMKGEINPFTANTKL